MRGEGIGGGAVEGGAPGSVGEAAGAEAGEGSGGRVRWFGQRWLRSGEVAIKGLGEDVAGPGGDVEVVVGAEAFEAQAELGADADLEGVASTHVMTC